MQQNHTKQQILTAP